MTNYSSVLPTLNPLGRVTWDSREVATMLTAKSKALAKQTAKEKSHSHANHGLIVAAIPNPFLTAKHFHLTDLVILL